MNDNLKIKISTAKWCIMKFVHEWYLRIFKIELTMHVTGTAEDQVPAEIEYRNSKGKCVGFWAYGSFDPSGPYRGQYNAVKNVVPSRKNGYYLPYGDH